jgi:YD repeat-containing protein
VSDLANWKVHGPVRMLKTALAEWDLSQTRWSPPRSLTVCTFRPDGKISESDYHNADGSVSHLKWLYDEAGRLVETQFRMNDGPPDRKLLSYDSAGRYVRTVRVNHDGTRRESEACSYDSRGRKTSVCFLAPHDPNAPHAYGVEGSETAYGAPGATTMTVTYDESNQATEVLFHDADRHQVSRVTFVRDAAGRLVSEEQYIGEQILHPDLLKRLEGASPEDHAGATALFAKLLSPSQAFTSIAHEYDQDGRLLLRSRRMAGLSEERTTFRYDDHGNPIEETTERNSREIGIGDHGGLRTASENSRKQQACFDYRYDARGNWTERIVWMRYDPNQDFLRSNVERREISYHGV